MYKHSFRVCFCFRRRFRTNVAEAPEDVKMMFNQYSENGTMNIDQLQMFLEEIQGEESDIKAQAIFNNLKHLNIFQRRGLRLEDFFRYLLGDLNLAFPPSQGDQLVEEDKDEDIVIPEYRSLIAIHAKKMKRGSNLQTFFNDIEKVSRLSLSEQELENAITNYGHDIIRFTQRNLLRVYPKGLRLDSSNYNPMLGWTHGAQMVAFNMQGYGKYLWIMEGMFRGNGGCGYIKKPDFLLNNPDHTTYNSKSTSSTMIKRLKIKVYMGEGWHLEFGLSHFDFYSPPDLYVKIRIVGVREDTVTRRTIPIEDQWVPVWNEEFSFSISAPELALLQIVVRDHDTSGKDDFAGQTCLPVKELRSGIRAVPLYNRKGERYKHVKLLMRFEFE